MPSFSQPPAQHAPRSRLPASFAAQPDDNIEATGVIRALMEHYDGPTPTYPQIKTKLYAGRIPGTKLPNGKWVVPRSDLGAVAAEFGMVLREAKSPKARGEPRAAAASVVA